MAIGNIYNHLAITVMTVINSGMISSAWLGAMASDWLSKVSIKEHLPLLQAQLLPM